MPDPQDTKKVYQEQDRILVELKKERPFPYVLSGGTALSRFYLHHRFSEDLDFFDERLTFSFQRIEAVIGHLRRRGLVCELIGRTDRPDRLKAASYIIGSCPIKVDFIEDPFSGMWDPVSRKSDSGITFRIDALDQIYYRKFFSLLEQWHHSREVARTKDLLDLYCLHRYHRSIEGTLALFRKNHVPIDEEKMMMIFAAVKKADLEKGLKDLGASVSAEEICAALKKTSDRLFRRGISQ